MASVKNKPTVAIVNPKDPQDPVPWHANVEDVAKHGWTLWADRHDPARLADVEKAAAAKAAAEAEAAKEMPVVGAEGAAAGEADNKADEKPAEVDEDAPKGSAVDPSQVKKAPAKKS